MTTAYTSLLGLALPVTGELSGVWGDTVNNSITSLLDSAIAGTTTISSDADVTLTTTTGASNTSRQAILLWTAGGTVTRNITAPAQSKIYTVINKSSSTQSIVLRGVGPTTGVTIVQGESAVCAWNGSDFIKISNTSGAGVFTTLSVSGAVTLSGGTANGVAYLNGSKVLTTGSALVFDGTNLGVGESTPTAKLHIGVASAAVNGTKGVRITNPAGTIVMLECGSGGDSFVGTTSGSDFNIRTNNITRATFDNAGNLLVGSSSTIGTGGKFQVTSSTDTSIFKCTSSTTYAAIVSNVENTAARLIAFQYGSGGSPTNVGTITTNGTGVTYGTSSDYRLKENIVSMTGALDKVAQLKPVTYKWKINGSDGQGFIAHELAEVVPDAVQGEKDAVDADGNPTYQGIDTSYLVATLTAAIQEQQTLITQLIARITALESA